MKPTLKINYLEYEPIVRPSSPVLLLSVAPTTLAALKQLKLKKDLQQVSLLPKPLAIPSCHLDLS